MLDILLVQFLYNSMSPFSIVNLSFDHNDLEQEEMVLSEIVSYFLFPPHSYYFCVRIILYLSKFQRHQQTSLIQNVFPSAVANCDLHIEPQWPTVDLSGQRNSFLPASYLATPNPSPCNCFLSWSN